MGAQAVIRASGPGDVEVLHRFLVELAELVAADPQAPSRCG